MKSCLSKITVSILIAFTFFNNLSAQNTKKKYQEYHHLIEKAKNNKTDSTCFYFEKAFAVAEPFPQDLKSLAFQYYKRNNFKKADKYFIESIKSGYQFEHDIEFKNLPLKINYEFGFKDRYANSKSLYGDFIRKMFNRNLKKARKAREKFLEGNEAAQNEIFEVLLQNERYFQNVRLELLPKKKIDSIEYEIVAKYLNAGNSYLMLELLENSQFPYRTKCSRFNPQTINMLLNHAVASFINKDDAKKFIDLLWSQVENGNITPHTYANIYDHYFSWYENNDLTYFGSTVHQIQDVDGYICIDVFNPELLNNRRSKYWLSPIEVFCKKSNFKLPLNYKQK